jgi:hypothetical protein
MQADSRARPGDIVQVKPGLAPNPDWDACLVVVTEVKIWGVQGYTTVPAGGEAYIRLKWEQFEVVGRAAFMRTDEAEGTDG